MNFGIIAAGEGSRLVQEGVGKPKPLVDLDGRPMIRRLMDIFVECGAERICLIVNEEMEEVQDYIREIGVGYPVPVHMIINTTPSSMHSFREVAGYLKDFGRFIVTTVDTIFRPEDFRKYVEAYGKSPEQLSGMMAVTRYIDDEKPLYVATDAEGIITGFLDKPETGVEFVSGGIYGLDGRALPVLEDCLEKGIARMRNFQRALVASGMKLEAFDMGKIIDVDHASDIAVAREFLK